MLLNFYDMHGLLCDKGQRNRIDLQNWTQLSRVWTDRELKLFPTIVLLQEEKNTFGVKGVLLPDWVLA